MHFIARWVSKGIPPPWVGAAAARFTARPLAQLPRLSRRSYRDPDRAERKTRSTPLRPAIHRQPRAGRRRHRFAARPATGPRRLIRPSLNRNVVPRRNGDAERHFHTITLLSVLSKMDQTLARKAWLLPEADTRTRGIIRPILPIGARTASRCWLG